MSDVAVSKGVPFGSWASEDRPALAPKESWPLMGDVHTARGGVPEHLIQWRRAAGESDPEPQL